MLNNEFKKSAIEKLKSMDSNELKKAFKEIGSEPETNEEWLKQCDTEQLAEWIFRVREKCYYCGARQIPDREHCAFGDEFCRNNRHEFVEWLKQPHREELTSK